MEFDHTRQTFWKLGNEKKFNFLDMVFIIGSFDLLQNKNNVGEVLYKDSSFFAA